MINRPRIVVATAAAVLLAGAMSAFAQSLPTTQPKLLQIYREQVKTGHAAAHAKVEAGWPAAFAKAKSPDYYLALSSMTGPQVVWFMSPWDSYTAWGKSMARDEARARFGKSTPGHQLRNIPRRSAPLINKLAGIRKELGLGSRAGLSSPAARYR